MGFDASHCKRKLSNVAFQDFEHQRHDFRHDLLRNNLYCDRMHAACRYKHHCAGTGEIEGGVIMKVVRLGNSKGLDGLSFVEEAKPGTPASGQILVRLHASSVNYHDYSVAMGRLPSAPAVVLLSDGAGVVEAVGEGVTEFGVGDSVISCFFPQWHDGEPAVADFSGTPGDGVDGYAREYVVRPAHWFTRAPRHMSPLEAATLPTAALTAWRALVVDGPLKAGDSVLVLGTGGVSIIALQLAKMMGATVIATSSSDAKLERARALGADHVINYIQHADWSEQVLNITGGRGVDHVIEVGGPATLPQSIAACRIGGHIALIGVLTGYAGNVPTVKLMSRQQRLQGVTVGSRRHQQDMVRALNATGLKPVIDRTFPLGALVEGFRCAENGDHFGKIGVSI
jgi:NADPH:quinone reductase-like Zn-dependent oxidoreductase